MRSTSTNSTAPEENQKKNSTTKARKHIVKILWSKHIANKV